MGCLDGKPVVVTGAGRGLGAAYARLAAQEGALVVVNDIDADMSKAVAEEITAAGGTAIARGGDVSDWGQAEELIDFCVAELGSIAGLVNNAGLFAMSLADQMTEAELTQLWGTNVSGLAACGAFAIRRMTAQGSGSIVNVASGAHFGMKHMPAYAATKGAVASLTYAWAIELEATGVRINALSPLARTRMADASARFYEEHNMGRVDVSGAPDPSANAPVVIFLLSDAASHVHGQMVRIEGNQLSLVAHPVVLEPVLVADGGWTPDTVAAAFDGELAKRLVPLGLRPRLKGEYLV